MPRNTTSSVFFYTYVLESLKDGKKYIGYTNNLKNRIEEHKIRLPFKLIYFEGCKNMEDAKRRENYLNPVRHLRQGFLKKNLKSRSESKLLYWVKTTQGASPVIQLLMRSAQKRRRRQKMIYGARFLGLRLLQYQGQKKTFGTGSCITGHAKKP